MNPRDPFDDKLIYTEGAERFTRAYIAPRVPTSHSSSLQSSMPMDLEDRDVAGRFASAPSVHQAHDLLTSTCINEAKVCRWCASSGATAPSSNCAICRALHPLGRRPSAGLSA
eukprot:GHVT01046146.1.p1 GENE.GHVT01046146.1~~GHVT01046146.1.p1  ORF type:complete len:113 (-),score=1.06 GHVT01046146.1:78-416(-)